MKRLIGALLLVCALLLVAGGYLSYRFRSAPVDRLAGVVPADAVLYANLFIQPSTAQARQLGDLVSKLVETDAGGEIGERLQDVVAPCGGDFETFRDMGATQIALFFMADGALGCVVDAPPSDEMQLESDAIREVRGHLVLGDISAVDASRSTTEQSSLASQRGYRQALARSEPDRLAFIHRVSSIGRTPERSRFLALADDAFSTIQHAVLRIEEDHLVLEGSVGSDGAELWQDRRPPPAGEAPAGASFVLSVRNLSGWLDALALQANRATGIDIKEIAQKNLGLTSEELWGWTDAARFWAGGTGFSIGAGMTAVADSPAVAENVETVTLPSLTSGRRSASPFLNGMLSSLVFAREGQVVSIQLGPELQGRLSEEERFTEAERWLDQSETSLFIDFTAAEGWTRLLPLGPAEAGFLAHLDRLIIGGGPEGGTFTWRAVLGVSED